jgi:phenylacetate-CoA ligase
MTNHYDELETRRQELREQCQLERLPRQLAHAKARAPAFSRILEKIDPTTITTRAALTDVPVTRKSDLLPLQSASRPFGGFAATQWGECARVFASPGPLYEPEGRGRDPWRIARSLFAAGFRAGDLVHNCYAYHFTPAGSMMETAAHALGCTVFPGGTGQTEMQVQAMADLRPDGYVGTPSFLKIILEKADEMGVKLKGLRKALVSAEPFPDSLRDWFLERGIAAYQLYATADVGAIAYETEARAGLVIDEGVLVEIVRPGTGDHVAPGEVGEVVVTALFNIEYPMIRIGTGDLSAVLPGPSPCGRTNTRIKGWMGRADQTTKVKGMFVHPSQIAAIASRHPKISKARLVVDNSSGIDRMTLHVEITGSDSSEIDAIMATVRDITKLRAEITFCAPGELPNDGKVIDDIRKFD